MTLEQEQAAVADRKLLLAAICALSQWRFEQIVASYRFTQAEVVQLRVRLDRLGIIELRPLNRYALKVARNFRWRADAPVMAYFRAQVAPDYFSGGFDGEGELLTRVHGEVSPGAAHALSERLQRLAQDFAQQHVADQHLGDEHKHPFTLLIGMRSWLFSAFRDLKRRDSEATPVLSG